MPTARARQLRCALKLAVLGKISALRRRLPRGFSPAVVFGSAAGGHFSPDRLTWVVGRSRVVFLRPVYGFPTYYQGSYRTWELVTTDTGTGNRMPCQAVSVSP